MRKNYKINKIIILRSKSQKHKNINLINLFAIKNNDSQNNNIGSTRFSERIRKLNTVFDNNGIVSEIFQKNNKSATNFNSNSFNKEKKSKSISKKCIREINMNSQSVDTTNITENY